MITQFHLFGYTNRNLAVEYTNYVHSRFENFSKISSKIRELKNENTLILDAGDFNDFMRLELQGTRGIAGCSLLNLAGYDAIAVGNNESFSGVDILENMTTSGLTPFLSCNLYRDDMTFIKGLKRSIIIEKGELKFLIIGSTPPYNEFLSLDNMHATNPMEEIKRELEPTEVAFSRPLYAGVSTSF